MDKALNFLFAGVVVQTSNMTYVWKEIHQYDKSLQLY